MEHTQIIRILDEPHVRAKCAEMTRKAEEAKAQAKLTAPPDDCAKTICGTVVGDDNKTVVG
jgi:hypothetical protein